MQADNSTFHWHWELAQRQREGGVWRGKEGLREMDGARKWGVWEGNKGCWHTQTSTLSNKKDKDDIDLKECVCVCVFMCQWVTGKCRSVYFRKAREIWQPKATADAQEHTLAPSSPMTFPKCYWPLGSRTGPLMKLLLAPILHPVSPERLQAEIKQAWTAADTQKGKVMVCVCVCYNLHILLPTFLF